MQDVQKEATKETSVPGEGSRISRKTALLIPMATNDKKIVKSTIWSRILQLRLLFEASSQRMPNHKVRLSFTKHLRGVLCQQIAFCKIRSKIDIIKLISCCKDAASKYYDQGTLNIRNSFISTN